MAIEQHVTRGGLLLAFSMFVAVLAYWTGLHGPFLLDDEANLRSIPEWMDDRLGLSTLLFERGAGILGRPVSMASFALNAWIGGHTPFSLKVGNLITHLLCGLVIFWFLRLLLRRDPLLQPHASLYSAIVASLWLLHPLHASTVLYVVQRMAQLSTLFILLGLWLYVSSRQRLECSPSLTARLGILAGIPLLTALAFLSKENGALLPLLCAVVEFAYYTGRRPRTVRLFLSVYVVLPIVAGVLLFGLTPSRMVGGYVSRDFTLSERMLSQPRALCEYLWNLAIPNPPRMGIYTDDFVASTGLLAPPTTLFAILLLLTVSIAAWHWRRRVPGLFFGWFFFLGAHALEASPLPLELYFEHRNYLPSVGVLLGLVALAVAAGHALARKGMETSRIGIVLTIGALAVLAFGTHGRAQVWRSQRLIAESSLLAHPYSLRANASVLMTSINDGDRQNANAAVQRLIDSPTQRHRSLGHSYRLWMECQLDHRGRVEDLEAFVTQTPMPLTLAESQPFSVIYYATEQQGCGQVTDRLIGESLVKLADRAHAYSDQSLVKIRIRYQAASYLVRAQQWPSALSQAKLAWQTNADPPVALPLILAKLHEGDVQGAKQTLQELESRADPTSAQDLDFIGWIRTEVDSAEDPVKLPK